MLLLLRGLLPLAQVLFRVGLAAYRPLGYLRRLALQELPCSRRLACEDPTCPRGFAAGLLMALVAVATAGMPAWAAPDPADRMQLHRNVNRGVPYIRLSQQGQTSSGATITMRAVRQTELDGDPLLNVRGNVYPIELNGGYGFVHFNGYRYMRVYDAGGRKLWQIDNPGGRVHRDALHRDTLAVLDADGDGDQDIAHCWVEGGRKVLLVRRGATGAVLRRASARQRLAQ